MNTASGFVIGRYVCGPSYPQGWHESRDAIGDSRQDAEAAFNAPMAGGQYRTYLYVWIDGRLEQLKMRRRK
jgi:hypothetical protein